MYTLFYLLGHHLKRMKVSENISKIIERLNEQHQLDNEDWTKKKIREEKTKNLVENLFSVSLNIWWRWESENETKKYLHTNETKQNMICFQTIELVISCCCCLWWLLIILRRWFDDVCDRALLIYHRRTSESKLFAARRQDRVSNYCNWKLLRESLSSIGLLELLCWV